MFSSRSVQIAAVFLDVFGQALPNLCKSFYNETKAEMFFSVFAVALLAEGVDRNTVPYEAVKLGRRGSLSSRRAWIEIRDCLHCLRYSSVALLAEGVDRNLLQACKGFSIQRSLSSRRAWIEISVASCLTKSVLVALLAEGVDRNLQPIQLGINGRMSLSSRRAWIEIKIKDQPGKIRSRSPRGGRG